MTILQSGGHVAELVLKENGALNPLWVQSRPTIDPDRFDPARDSANYGGGSGAKLMSGLAGHNLCFPFWGNPSDTEDHAGMTYHGETGIARWRKLAGGTDWLTVAADLPESMTRFTRTVRIRNQVALFEETAENLSAWDRPVGWCEHVTFGPPFLERGVTEFGASVTRGRVMSSGKEIQWSDGLATQSNRGFVDNFLIENSRDIAWITAYHPGRHLLVGYVFHAHEFPWLNVWESNSREMMTRGMELSNTPVHGTMRALMAEPKLWGTATFDWLPGKGKLGKRYLAFSMQAATSPGAIKSVEVKGNTLSIQGATLITLDLGDIVF